MFQTDLKKIFSALKDAGYAIYAPVKTPEGIFIKEIDDEKETDYSGKFPWDSWKRFVYPHEEKLFETKAGKFTEVKTKYPKIALWGINVVDLKAIGLTDLLFKDDPYYIERRKNIFIAGFSPKPLRDYQNFSFKINVDILEHLNYDLFILKKDGFKLYSASNVADKILKKAGVAADVLITTEDLVVEDKIMRGLEKLVGTLSVPMTPLSGVGKSFDHPVWKTLNDRCIACGKCSIACPTCYCFDLIDTARPLLRQGFGGRANGAFGRKPTGEATRERVWGDCFYSEFTRIAGNYIFLKNPGEKLFFWYTHKFSRLPAQTGYPGCVGCRRCYEVCPVFIDIEKTLADLKTDKAENSTR